MNNGDAATQQVDVMVSLGTVGHTRRRDGGFGDREDTAGICDGCLGDSRDSTPQQGAAIVTLGIEGTAWEGTMVALWSGGIQPLRRWM